MITIQELLYNRGLDPNANVKFIRHKEERTDLYNMYRHDRANFLRYQSEQGRHVFNNLDYVVSFIGEEGTLSRFIGVYRVNSFINFPERQRSEIVGEYSYLYELLEEPGYEDLSERVIIDWGQAARKWDQFIGNIKEVVEIHPGLHYQQFTDYFDFILDFDELTEIINSEYKDWKRMLSATKGVYLIQDSSNGTLYVGSAYNENGIWGRWKTYVKTNGHGNNKTLKDLVKANPSYSQNFRFSILMLLPKTISPDEPIAKEKLFKMKLGTNAFGLNNN